MNLDQNMHEKLCAYALGEGTEAERAEFAAQLLASPELRAELERIEGTIGLVREFAPSSPALDPRTREALIQSVPAAAAALQPVWFGRTWVRMAAGVFVLVGGFLFLRQMKQANMPPEQLAVLETPPSTLKPDRSGLAAAQESTKEVLMEQLQDLPVELAQAAAVAPKPAADTTLNWLAEPGKDPQASAYYAKNLSLDVQTTSLGTGADQFYAGLPAEKLQNKFGKAPGSPAASGPSSGGPQGPAGPSSTRGFIGGAGGGGAQPPLAGGAVAPSDLLEKRRRLETHEAKSSSKDDALVLQDEAVRESLSRVVGLGYVDENEAELPDIKQKREQASIEEYLMGCKRLPNERPRDVFFRFWGDNPFELTSLDPLSTFAADVDNASYTLARKTLLAGHLPEKAQIRTEEFINYFPADVTAPQRDALGIHTDLTPSRFGSGSDGRQRWMMRVVLRGQELSQAERKPLRLTFVIDCSGSMRQENRMEMVKDSLKLLLTQLRNGDSVGIVAFSTEAQAILPLTSIANRASIEAAIDRLVPDGWTNSEAGLRLGYETALAGLDSLATNRVIFLSDGVANRGITDPAELAKTVQPIREKGVFLNTFGVGMNNHNDALLEQLADKGDGQCHYIDDLREAQRVMVQRFMGTVETIARDVKIQVEFDPAQVERYRLLGYENRAVADADFRNDAVDAGEIGSGHQVTALYELERTASISGKPFAMVRVRYKDPRRPNAQPNEEARELVHAVDATQQRAFEVSSVGYRRAVLVAQYAEFLRRSVHARGDSFDELLAEAKRVDREQPNEEFHELVALLERTRELLVIHQPDCDELCRAVEALRAGEMRAAELEALRNQVDARLIEEVERRNQELELAVRAILQRPNPNSPR